MKFKRILSLSVVVTILVGVTALAGISMADITKAVATTQVISTTNNINYNGWQLINDNWYYYTNGVLKTGWIQDNGAWYYLNSEGIMLKGWVNTNGTWYYLNDSGAMLSNTTMGVYVLNESGACLNPNGTSVSEDSTNSVAETEAQTVTIETPSTNKIKSILKDEYGFINYNDGVLLNPDGEKRDKNNKGYLDDQIIFREVAGEQNITIMKHDSETINSIKDVLNVIFSDKADEAYSLLTAFNQSGQKEATYKFYGKSIEIVGATNGNIFYYIQ